MFKKISFLLLTATLISCSSSNKEDSQKNAEGFLIEDQIVDESSYQVIADEKQAEKLNETEKNFDMTEVAPDGAVVKEVEVKDRVLFGYDSAAINEEAAKILDVQIGWLKSNPEIKITIEGHCDERGTREYNIALGEKRAIAAKKHLVNGGIDASRIKTISYGKERPAFFGTAEDVQAKNRRAVVVTN